MSYSPAGLYFVLSTGSQLMFFSAQLTWADLSFLVYVSGLKKHGNEYDAILDKYPKLRALEKRVESVPRVAAWIAKRPVTDF